MENRRPPRRRWRRRLGISLAVLLAMVVAAVAVLRSAPFERWIVARGIAAARDATGLELAIGSLELAPLAGRAELNRLRLGDPGAAAPFARAERLTVAIELGSILRGPLVIRALHLDGLIVDPAAPLHPTLPPEENGEPTRLVVRDLLVEGVVVRNLDCLSPTIGSWLGATEVTGLGLHGSLEGDEVRLSLGPATVHLGGGRLRAASYRLVAELGGSLAGTLSIDGVRLTGEGLDLSAEGSWAMGPGDRQLGFSLEARLAELLAGDGGSGTLAARADVDLLSGAGTVELRLREVDGAVAERLAPMIALPASLRSDQLSLDADGRLALDAGGSLQGPLTALLRLRGESLIELTAVAGPSLDPSRPQRWQIDGTLLARWAGESKLKATIDLPGATVMDDALLDAKIQVALPDVLETWGELERLVAMPALPAAAKVPGRLTLSATAGGLLLDPRVELGIGFEPRAGGMLEGDLDLRPAERSGHGVVRLNRLPVALLAPDGVGLVDGAVDLALRAGELSTRASLRSDGIELAGLPLEQLALDVRQAGDQLTIERLELSRDGGRLAATGSLALTAPLSRADLAIQAERPVDGIESARLELSLVEGVLQVLAAELQTAIGPLTARASLPLAALEELPGMGAAMSELPVERARGPLQLELDAAELDTSGLWPALSLSPAAADLRGSLHLETRAELERPSDSRLLLTVESPRVVFGERVLVGDDTIRLQLDHGRLDLAPVSFHGDGLTATLQGDTALVRQWSLAQPLVALFGDAAATVSLTVEAELLATALGATEPSGEARARLDIRRRDGQLVADLTLPPAELEWSLPAADPGGTPRPTLVGWGDGRGIATAELGQPLAGSLRFELADPRASIDGHLLEAKEPLLLTYQEGHVELLPWPLSIDGEPFEIDARADFDPALPLSPAAIELALEAHGEVAAAALEPFLVGAKAHGRLRLDASLHGPADRISGHAEVVGDNQTSFRLFRPYAVRLRAPRLSARLEDGATIVDALSAELNEGRLEGQGLLSADGSRALSLRLDDVRLRVDYGVSTRLDAELELALDADGAGLLSGTIDVERAALTRDLDLEREVLAFLLPAELGVGTGDPLEAIGLDLTVRTTDGLRIANNVADLRATWSPIAVGGNLALPALRGTVAVDPGGLVYAYGQTVRLDRAELTWNGDPLAPPFLDLATTSELEDPSIEASWDRDLTWSRATVFGREEPGVDTRAIGGDLAGYVGQRLANRLNRGLAAARLELRPLIVYDEVSPDARLTLARQLSSSASFGLTLDLRDAQRQTYLLDLHDLPSLPRFTARAFTTDAGGEGLAVQQSLEWGGWRPPSGPLGPRLKRVVVPGAGRKIRRLVRRAVQAEIGKPIADGAAFEAELDVELALRRRGWADPRIEARVDLRDDGRADLVVEVDPGPQASFVFTGDRLGRRTRRSITELYRADAFESESLDEMEVQAKRLLLAGGHLEPLVKVSVAPIHTQDPRGARSVRIDVEAGPRRRLPPPTFPALDPEDQAWLAARFSGPLARAELALGTASASAALERHLRSLGYPAGRVGDITFDDDLLVVQLDLGEREQLGAVSVEGISGLDQEVPPTGSLELRRGDPARRHRVAEAALELERALEERGYLEARVQGTLTPSGEPHRLDLSFAVDVGPHQRLIGTALTEGLRSRPGFVQATAGLDSGAELRRSTLELARRRLFATGLYSAVDLSPESTASGDTVLRFDLRERSPWSLAYGVRWSSDDELSAVVDVLDRNLLGRGITLGARTAWSRDDQRLRLFGHLPRLFRSATQLMLFAEQRHEVSEGIVTDSSELSLQLSRSLTPHLELRTYGRYRERHFTEEEPDPFFPLDERVRSPFLGVQLLYDRRDDPLLTQQGLFWSADLSGADDAIGSDFRYLRFFGQLSAFQPVGRLLGRPLVWAQSWRLGAADAFDQELLRDLRFFAGGEFSVRGYRRDSLGPAEVLGDLVRPLGGEGLLVLTQELRLAITGDLQVLAFVDAGNVWEHVGDFDGRLSTAFGLGLRALTPLGLIRLDLGVPLDKRPDDDGLQVSFGFGSSF